MVLLVKNITTYKELKPLYDGYKKSRDKEKFLRGHESDIIFIGNSNDAPTFFVVDYHTLF